MHGPTNIKPPSYLVSSYAVPHKRRLPQDPNILSHTERFVHTMLKIHSSCCTSVIRNSRSTILLNFGNKAPVKNLWSLSLSLRRGTCWFWSWLRVVGSLNEASSCLRACNEHWAAATGQGIVRMLAGYEEILKEKERCLCLEISVLYLFRNWCITSCIAGHSRWWTRTPAYISRGSVLSLNCRWFLRYRTCFNFP